MTSQSRVRIGFQKVSQALHLALCSLFDIPHKLNLDQSSFSLVAKILIMVCWLGDAPGCRTDVESKAITFLEHFFVSFCGYERCDKPIISKVDL